MRWAVISGKPSTALQNTSTDTSTTTPVPEATEYLNSFWIVGGSASNRACRASRSMERDSLGEIGVVVTGRAGARRTGAIGPFRFAAHRARQGRMGAVTDVHRPRSTPEPPVPEPVAAETPSDAFAPFDD